MTINILGMDINIKDVVITGLFVILAAIIAYRASIRAKITDTITKRRIDEIVEMRQFLNDFLEECEKGNEGNAIKKQLIITKIGLYFRPGSRRFAYLEEMMIKLCKYPYCMIDYYEFWNRVRLVLDYKWARIKKEAHINYYIEMINKFFVENRKAYKIIPDKAKHYIDDSDIYKITTVRDETKPCLLSDKCDKDCEKKVDRNENA